MTKKYGNKKIQADGYTFDSQAEQQRYQELLLLKKAGAIVSLKVHPKYELLPAFRDRSGTWRAAITYTADFSYIEDGCGVVEDVKGVRTQVFRIKEKLFRRWWGHLDLRILDV
jgi:hypothetical protein